MSDPDTHVVEESVDVVGCPLDVSIFQFDSGSGTTADDRRILENTRSSERFELIFDELDITVQNR